ncbi:hypothetical protein EDF77_0993 [Stenotrophomonas maltophilia]|nr:hypothetical protein [Stenotrophomonas sp. SORGH_AS_0321]ROQ46094.1 hypothetical protein EDF77_0993 [Stenotrophomonas maltophilia]
MISAPPSRQTSRMIPTSYWRKSWGSFVRPNTGSFDIRDVSCLQEPTSLRIVHLYRIDACCLGCNHVFSARDGHGMATVTGARVLTCPGCSASQAVSNSELAGFFTAGTATATAPVTPQAPGQVAAAA